MRKLFLSLSICTIIFGCNIPWPPFPPGPTPTPTANPTPDPTPDPTPTPVPTPCLPELPWCNEVGMHCGECKHNPTQDPNHCEKAPPCSTPEPTPVPTPTPTPGPPTANCPKQLAPGAVVYMNNHNYGQGFDSAVRVRGDSQFCFLIHGVNTNDCHLDGWPKRVQCEMELLGGCPRWQFSNDNGATANICHDDQSAFASCDHFGNTVFRDDPKTPDVFEGQPKECGNQRDEFGPNAGFFTIAHGAGLIRSCKPDLNPSTCGPWRTFNH